MSTEAKLQEALGTKETSKSDDGSVWGELKKLFAAFNDRAFDFNAKCSATIFFIYHSRNVLNK